MYLVSLTLFDVCLSLGLESAISPQSTSWIILGTSTLCERERETLHLFQPPGADQMPDRVRCCPDLPHSFPLVRSFLYMLLSYPSPLSLSVRLVLQGTFLGSAFGCLSTEMVTDILPSSEVISVNS